jgi:hypothetical protein
LGPDEVKLDDGPEKRGNVSAVPVRLGRPGSSRVQIALWWGGAERPGVASGNPPDARELPTTLNPESEEGE